MDVPEALLLIDYNEILSTYLTTMSPSGRREADSKQHKQISLSFSTIIAATLNEQNT